MNSLEIKNDLIKDIEIIQDDVCLIMNSIHTRLVYVPRVGKVYDKFSRVWHTMRNIRLDLCFELGKESFRNPENKGQSMNKEYLILFLDDIIKQIKNLVIKLRDISNSEPKFFDLGFTPNNIKYSYQANNAWFLMEDVKKIIG